MVRETRHLWVGNLPDNVREERIREHFQRYGRVQSVKLLGGIKDETVSPGIGSIGGMGVSSGGLCATVAFMDIKSAAKAHAADNTLEERTLHTDYYEPPLHEEGGTGPTTPTVASPAPSNGSSVGGCAAGLGTSNSNGPVAGGMGANTGINSTGIVSSGTGNSTGINGGSPVATPRTPLSNSASGSVGGAGLPGNAHFPPRSPRFPHGPGEDYDRSSHFFGREGESPHSHPPPYLRRGGYHHSSHRERNTYRNGSYSSHYRNWGGGNGSYRTGGGGGGLPLNDDPRSTTDSNHKTLNVKGTHNTTTPPTSALGTAGSTGGGTERTTERPVTLGAGLSGGGSSSKSKTARSAGSDSGSESRSRSSPSRSPSPHSSPSRSRSRSRGSRSRSRTPVSRSRSRSLPRTRSRSPSTRSTSRSRSSSSSRSRSSRSARSSISRSPASLGLTPHPHGPPRASTNRQRVQRTLSTPPLAICVRNLPLRSSDTSLKDGLFHEYKKHGKVVSVKVAGQGAERVAVVCFKKPEDVDKALEVSRDKLFFGCKIEVTPCDDLDLDDNEFRPLEAELDEYHPKATRTLFIGNLEKDITASELRQHFERFGPIIEIDVKKQTSSNGGSGTTGGSGTGGSGLSTGTVSSLAVGLGGAGTGGLVVGIGGAGGGTSNSSTGSGSSSTGSGAGAGNNASGGTSYAFCQYADIASVVRAMRHMDGEQLGNTRVKLGFGKSMPTSCVWMHGIGDSVTEKFLARAMSRYGHVAYVAIDREKGNALVFYEQVGCAQVAVQEMRGRSMLGRKLQVDFASRECQADFFENLDSKAVEREGSRYDSPRYTNRGRLAYNRGATTPRPPPPSSRGGRPRSYEEYSPAGHVPMDVEPYEEAAISPAPGYSPYSGRKSSTSNNGLSVVAGGEEDSGSDSVKRSGSKDLRDTLLERERERERERNRLDREVLKDKDTPKSGKERNRRLGSGGSNSSSGVSVEPHPNPVGTASDKEVSTPTPTTPQTPRTHHWNHHHHHSQSRKNSSSERQVSKEDPVVASTVPSVAVTPTFNPVGGGVSIPGGQSSGEEHSDADSGTATGPSLSKKAKLSSSDSGVSDVSAGGDVALPPSAPMTVAPPATPTLPPLGRPVSLTSTSKVGLAESKRRRSSDALRRPSTDDEGSGSAGKWVLVTSPRVIPPEPVWRRRKTEESSESRPGTPLCDEKPDDAPLDPRLKCVKVKPELPWHLPLPRFAGEALLRSLSGSRPGSPKPPQAVSNLTQPNPSQVSPLTHRNSEEGGELSVAVGGLGAGPGGAAPGSPQLVVPPQALNHSTEGGVGGVVMEEKTMAAPGNSESDSEESSPSTSPKPPKATAAGPSLAERLKQLDLRYEMWSARSVGAYNTSSCTSPTSNSLELRRKPRPIEELQSSQPSDIVRSLLAKRSVFDEDLKRLENCHQKYDPNAIVLPNTTRPATPTSGSTLPVTKPQPLLTTCTSTSSASSSASLFRQHKPALSRAISLITTPMAIAVAAPLPSKSDLLVKSMSLDTSLPKTAPVPLAIDTNHSSNNTWAVPSNATVSPKPILLCSPRTTAPPRTESEVAKTEVAKSDTPEAPAEVQTPELPPELIQIKAEPDSGPEIPRVEPLKPEAIVKQELPDVEAMEVDSQPTSSPEEPEAESIPSVPLPLPLPKQELTPLPPISIVTTPLVCETNAMPSPRPRKDSNKEKSREVKVVKDEIVKKDKVNRESNNNNTTSVGSKSGLLVPKPTTSSCPPHSPQVSKESRHSTTSVAKKERENTPVLSAVAKDPVKPAPSVAPTSITPTTPLIKKEKEATPLRRESRHESRDSETCSENWVSSNPAAIKRRRRSSGEAVEGKKFKLESSSCSSSSGSVSRDKSGERKSKEKDKEHRKEKDKNREKSKERDRDKSREKEKKEKSKDKPPSSSSFKKPDASKRESDEDRKKRRESTDSQPVSSKKSEEHVRRPSSEREKSHKEEKKLKEHKKSTSEEKEKSREEKEKRKDKKKMKSAKKMGEENSPPRLHLAPPPLPQRRKSRDANSDASSDSCPDEEGEDGLTAEEKKLLAPFLENEPIYMSMYDKVKARSSRMRNTQAPQSKPPLELKDKFNQLKMSRTGKSRDDQGKKIWDDDDSGDEDDFGEEELLKSGRKGSAARSRLSSTSASDSGGAGSDLDVPLPSSRKSGLKCAVLGPKTPSRRPSRQADDSDSDLESKSKVHAPSFPKKTPKRSSFLLSDEESELEEKRTKAIKDEEVDMEMSAENKPKVNKESSETEEKRAKLAKEDKKLKEKSKKKARKSSSTSKHSSESTPVPSLHPATGTQAVPRKEDKMENIFGPLSDDSEEEAKKGVVCGSSKKTLPLPSIAKTHFSQMYRSDSESDQILAKNSESDEKKAKKKANKDKERVNHPAASLTTLDTPLKTLIKEEVDSDGDDLVAAGKALESQLLLDETPVAEPHFKKKKKSKKHKEDKEHKEREKVDKADKLEKAEKAEQMEKEKMEKEKKLTSELHVAIESEPTPKCTPSPSLEALASPKSSVVSKGARKMVSEEPPPPPVPEKVPSPVSHAELGLNMPSLLEPPPAATVPVPGPVPEEDAPAQPLKEEKPRTLASKEETEDAVAGLLSETFDFETGLETTDDMEPEDIEPPVVIHPAPPPEPVLPVQEDEALKAVQSLETEELIIDETPSVPSPPVEAKEPSLEAWKLLLEEEDEAKTPISASCAESSISLGEPKEPTTPQDLQIDESKCGTEEEEESGKDVPLKSAIQTKTPEVPTAPEAAKDQTEAKMAAKEEAIVSPRPAGAASAKPHVIKAKEEEWEDAHKTAKKKTAQPRPNASQRGTGRRRATSRTVTNSETDELHSSDVYEFHDDEDEDTVVATGGEEPKKEVNLNVSKEELDRSSVDDVIEDVVKGKFEEACIPVVPAILPPGGVPLLVTSIIKTAPASIPHVATPIVTLAPPVMKVELPKQPTPEALPSRIPAPVLPMPTPSPPTPAPALQQQQQQQPPPPHQQQQHQPPHQQQQSTPVSVINPTNLPYRELHISTSGTPTSHASIHSPLSVLTSQHGTTTNLVHLQHRDVTRLSSPTTFHREPHFGPHLPSPNHLPMQPSPRGVGEMHTWSRDPHHQATPPVQHLESHQTNATTVITTRPPVTVEPVRATPPADVTRHLPPATVLTPVPSRPASTLGGTNHFPSVPLTRDRDMPIVSVSSTPAQQHGPGSTHNVLRMDHTSRSSATPTVATVGSLSGGATVIAVAARGPGSLPVSSPSLLTSAPTQYHPSVGVSTLVIARQQGPPPSSHARHVAAGHPGPTGTYGLRPAFTASSSVPTSQQNVPGTKLTAVVVGQSQRVGPTPVSVAGGVGGASLTLFPAPIRLQHAQPAPAVSVYPIYSSRPSAPAQQQLQQQPPAQTNTPVQPLPLPTAPQQQPQQQLPAAAAVPGREEYTTAVAPRVSAVAHAHQQQRERELVREEEPRSRTPLTQPHLPTVPRVLTPGLGMAPYDPALHGGGHSHLPSGFSPSLPLRELPTPPPAHQHSPQPEVLRTSHFPPHILHHHQQYFYQQYIRAQQEAALQQAHHSRLYMHPESGTPPASATPAPAAEPPKEERESRDRTPLLPPHLRPSPVPADRSTDSPHLYHRGPTYTPHPHRPYYERPAEEPYPSPPPAHAHSHPAPAPIPPTRTAVPQQQQPVLPPQGALPPSSAGLPAAHAHSGHGPYAHTPGQSQLPSHPSLAVAMGPAGGPVACTSHSRLHAVRTPPHASQVPPQADSLLSLLQRYPVMWQGQLALKNDMASVQMHFVSGNPNVARGSLPLQSDGNAVPLRIAQRMRLEQTQLEGVARKMQMEAEHCMLLALPCGRDHMDVLQQSNNLRHGFITYLQLKQAAGIVNVAVPGSQQAAYVVHVFPACDFANENLARIAPDLLHRVADIGHLLVVIATV